MKQTTIKWGYDLEIYNETGLKVSIRLPIATHCHALITGASGSGKSMALLYMLGMVLKAESDITIFLCDFKKSDDFAFMDGYEHYYAGNSCYDGIMEYYDIFTKIRESGHSSRRFLLICDEYPAFINYLQGQDKANKTKRAPDILNAVSEILMLGRGINFGIYLVTQRADAALFANGSRDNFMVIVGLGRMSKEQKTMLFAGEEIPDCIFHPGEGVIFSDGYPLRLVKFPRLSDSSDWCSRISSAIRRSGGA